MFVESQSIYRKYYRRLCSAIVTYKRLWSQKKRSRNKDKRRAYRFNRIMRTVRDPNLPLKSENYRDSLIQEVVLKKKNCFLLLTVKFMVLSQAYRIIGCVVCSFSAVTASYNLYQWFSNIFFVYHLGVLLISHVPLMTKNRTNQINRIFIINFPFYYHLALRVPPCSLSRRYYSLKTADLYRT
ncbi:hypothetical protein AGLY_000934 [Aphis glycines]|uniref:Uncharacterized protein n=1 Tax=Aphis glycines TaxID=307491 RepID=A0A6G0U8D5_APHGL|nr:hypothetical protein AGLY_000934 [Aphis glycines]